MDQFPQTVMLVGVPVAVLTALTIQAAKEAGLPGQWAPLSAVLVAAAFVALGELAGVLAWVEIAGRVIVGGLVIGLASSGGYSWARMVGKDREEE